MAYSAKRRSPRISQREAVRIKNSHGILYAVFEDLSAVGLKLFTDNPMTVGEVLLLEFTCRDSAGESFDVKVEGRVARCAMLSSSATNPYEIGIAFNERLPTSILPSDTLESASDAELGRF